VTTSNISIDQVNPDRFTREAECLLGRSPGYLAVALVKGEEVLHWMTSSYESKDQPHESKSQDQENIYIQSLKRHLYFTLSTLKYLALTLPRRSDDGESLMLSLSYQLPQRSDRLSSHRIPRNLERGPNDLEGGSVYAHELAEGLLLLFTREGELSERARFWLKHYSLMLSQPVV